MATTGEKASAIRRAKRINQRDAGECIGCSTTTMVKKEAGTSEWTITELQKLSAFFGVPLADLIGD